MALFPIAPNAPAAEVRTSLLSSCNAIVRAGTASFASSPISPNLLAAARRTCEFLCCNAFISFLTSCSWVSHPLIHMLTNPTRIDNTITNLLTIKFLFTVRILFHYSTS